MNRRGGSIVSLLPILAAVTGTTGIVAGYTHFQLTAQPVDITAQFDAAVETENDEYLKLTSVSTSATVAQDDDNLARRLRSFGLRLSSDGKLPGRITWIEPATGDRIVASDVTIKFVQRGTVVQAVKPGLNGVFQASGLQPGIYSIIAAGKEGFMGFSARVLPAGDEVGQVTAEDNHIRLVGHSSSQDDSGLQVDGAAVPSRDFKPLKEIVDVYLPRVGYSKVPRSKNDTIKLASLQDDKDSSVPPVPDPTTTDDADESELANDEAVPATNIKSHAVRLTAAGDLAGRIRRLSAQTGRPTPVRRMNVFLLKDGELYTQSTVRENGTFLFRDVPAGVYSFIAASSDGFLAFGVQLISSEIDTRTASLDIPTELVANIFAMQDGTELDGSVIPPEDLDVVKDEVDNLPDDEDDGDDEGEGGGEGGEGGGGEGGGQGGGGSGGGGDGGGILPALIGAGVGAGIGAALADDDDNETSP